MGKASREKGKRGERELVSLAVECGFPKACRGAPMQACGGELLPDVHGITGLWAEAKRRKRLPIAAQALELLAQERPGYTSVLFHCGNGRAAGTRSVPARWLATLDARELLHRHRELLDLRREVLELRAKLERHRWRCAQRAEPTPESVDRESDLLPAAGDRP